MAGNQTDVAFNNCALFSTCKTEINDLFIDEANHIYTAMLCTIWSDKVIIMQIHQDVYGSLKETKFC